MKDVDSMMSGEKGTNSINNYMKRLLIVLGLVFGLTTVYGGPDKGHKKGRGKGKPTPEQVEAWKAKWEDAKKKRDKKRGDAKKRGTKRGPGGAL
jgi:hypothetical protein